MSDLISREAAIEEIARRDTTDGTIKVFSGKEVAEILNSLPSAQPEIIRCKDCKHYEDGWIHCNRVTWWNGSDDFCSRAERRTDATD